MNNRTISSRLYAQLLARRLLGAQAGDTRSLIVDVAGLSCTCVYASGHEPVAVWQMGLDALATAIIAMAGCAAREPAARDGASRLSSIGSLRTASRSVERVVIVWDRQRPHARLLARALVGELFGEAGTRSSTDRHENAPRMAELVAPALPC